MKFIVAGGLNMFANWKQIERTAVEADQLGYWGFVLPDHYMWGPDRGGNSTIETWTALTYLAAKTEKIRLGTLVTPIPFRPPGMLAKMVTTLDLLSNGRTVLGVGAGWSQTEFEGYSEWNSNKTRVDKTREGVELILKLWTQDNVDFKGKFYHAKGAVLDPKPVQKPHPPLLFAGIRPRMLRMAGEYADICMIPGFPGVDNPKSRKIVIDEAHRRERTQELSMADMAPFPRSPESRYERKEYQKHVEAASEAGSKYFVVPFPSTNYLGSLLDFAENIIPSFSR